MGHMLLYILQNAHSPFGAFLDPVADKLMVATVLVLLSTQPLAAGPLAGNAWVMPVVTLSESLVKPGLHNMFHRHAAGAACCLEWAGHAVRFTAPNHNGKQQLSS